MNRKLTLSVDGVSIERAKRYARKRRVSVSRIVESFLKMISLEDQDRDALPPVTAELFGVLKANGRKDIRKDYTSYLQEKYR